jgi:hypothetical protein
MLNAKTIHFIFYLPQFLGDTNLDYLGFTQEDEEE